ncbi:MAG: hypothetical protein HC805_05155 [Alkalinema sp. RL_2_19]|nr:hypothetical protein [Alkalinema sp. RL_2_19]
MQINIDLPETLALQLSQGSHPAAEVVEQGLNRLGMKPHQSAARKSRKRSTRLPDWANPQTEHQVATATEHQVPDVMDFLDDLAQRREALLEMLRSRPDNE